jgi:hypothetical protein
MGKLTIIKIGKEITGVFISPELVQGCGFESLHVNIVDFSKALAPWEDKVLDDIEQLKLVKIA